MGRVLRTGPCPYPRYIASSQVKELVERVVQLVRDGVTGMDLLEVFLDRRI